MCTLAGTEALVAGALKRTRATLAVQGTGPALSGLSSLACPGWGFSRSSPFSSIARSRAQWMSRSSTADADPAASMGGAASSGVSWSGLSA